MGGLVNDPAFKKIAPLWTRNKTPMLTETPTAPATAPTSAPAPIPAAPAPAAPVVPPQTLDALRAKDAELAQAKLELQAANDALRTRNQERADAAIAAAQARGALPTQPEKDSEAEKLICRYRKLIVDDPANEVLLAQLPAAAAVSGALTAGRREVRANVSRPSMENVLRAMNTERDPLLSGKLYCREIKPLFGGHRDPSGKWVNTDNGAWQDVMRAANAIGTTAGVLVVQRCLDLLKYELPLLSRITTDFSAEPVKYGQAVYTRLRAVPVVGTYNTATGYPDSDVTDTDATITINQHKCVQIVYTANDLASTARLLFPEQEEGMHYAIAQDMMNGLTALMTAANFPGQAGGGVGVLAPASPGNTVAPLDQFARATVIAVKSALHLRGVMGGTRSILLNSLYHGQLELDTTVVGNLINRDSDSSIQDGTLPIVAGFKPIEAPYLPANAVGGGTLAGFGMRADALALAARLPNDYSNVFPGVTGGGVVQIVTNPDTGMSVMLVMFLDHKLGQTRMRVAWMWGAAVGNGNCGQTISTQ